MFHIISNKGSGLSFVVILSTIFGILFNTTYIINRNNVQIIDAKVSNVSFYANTQVNLLQKIVLDKLNTLISDIELTFILPEVIVDEIEILYIKDLEQIKNEALTQIYNKISKENILEHYTTTLPNTIIKTKIDVNLSLKNGFLSIWTDINIDNIKWRLNFMAMGIEQIEENAENAPIINGKISFKSPVTLVLLESYKLD
ncbi:hypothetical protein AN641_03470 [Candidatus Epulonipiscioides gigas]|nr:hypothetical protein AN641_03470 [Epulopiscium sp. SCG-C07WGA-EpuloA2]